MSEFTEFQESALDIWELMANAGDYINMLRNMEHKVNAIKVTPEERFLCPTHEECSPYYEDGFIISSADRSCILAQLIRGQ